MAEVTNANESATATPATPVEEKPKSIADYFKLSQLPEAALKPVTEKVDEYLSLVSESNKLVAAVNRAREENPNNPEYLDKVWKGEYLSSEEMVEVEAEYQAAVAVAEEKLKVLREFAKGRIPEELSEEKAKEARKQVNEFSPILAESRKAIAAQVSLVESMLGVFNVAIPDGGLVTLLPNAESMKNARGRKATTAAGGIGQYMTRVGDVLIDGESTQRDGKGKFNYAADKLTAKWNGNVIPDNRVTPEELEEAFFADGLGKELRSVPGAEIPIETEFEFSKTVKVKNTNDDGFTEVPQKVKLTVRNQKYAELTEKKDAETAENKPAETPAAKTAESKPETTKAEPMKIDTRTEAQKAAAKKTAAKPEAK